jgi:hypothetical protein
MEQHPEELLEFHVINLEEIPGRDHWWFTSDDMTILLDR